MRPGVLPPHLCRSSPARGFAAPEVKRFLGEKECFLLSAS
ncbi:MAG: hypothetical protein BLITH_0567 [Brockia lithotrophica]|uniref:Uncharacterized protein n=1 Tax=Brockia lithotrophica TaxID=933949 RepID=A0A2T5G4L5_9BACL|nr:MAG: hypothetical protein BLITH_0567 [Brockia lithotrophica]